MVEKIDRSEIKSPYYVDSTTETKDDSHGRDQAEEQGDEYSGLHADSGWQKIYASASNRRYVKLSRENIAHIWFRGTTMQRGISLAEVDVATKDGRILKNAHAILAVREDFWTLKKFQSGQELPINLIVKQSVLEISLPSEIKQNVATTAAPSKPLKQGVFPKNKIGERSMYMWIAILAAIFMLLLFILYANI